MRVTGPKGLTVNPEMAKALGGHTPEELAKAYVDTIMGPLNAWGQCVHPTLGRSDSILLRLQRAVGETKTAELINGEIANWRTAHGKTPE